MPTCNVCGEYFQYPNPCYAITDPETRKVYELCEKCYKVWINGKLPVKDMLPKLPDDLSKVFTIPNRTLKLKPKDGVPLQDLMTHALNVVNTSEDIGRIEFKWGRNYIVVAKLRE